MRMQINRRSTRPEDYLDTFVTRFPHVQVRAVSTPQVFSALRYCGNICHQQVFSREDASLMTACMSCQRMICFRSMLHHVIIKLLVYCNSPS